MATQFGYPNPLHYNESIRQLASVKFNGIAQERGEIEFGDGYITWLGSELGTLRLYREYGSLQDRISQGYSQNLDRHYFTLEF